METPGEVEDLASLSKLDEAVLLNELKTRYIKDRIYTYVGDILVAVNPFKDLGIYGKDTSQKYQMAKRGDHPPHIFALADTVYQAMLGLRGTQPQNQCILISGESGAGKTESTKLIIKQLVDLCKGNTQLEQQILQVNPLLEAFGNAQTLMNDNSSRFGKYILLHFQDGQVLGSKISEYLLEKSRVVLQSGGEENFHIFYYMFAGLEQEARAHLRLGEPSSYKYLTGGPCSLKKQRKWLKEQYEELINAMDMVGFTDDEQENMFKVLAAVLTLGNIEIGINDNGEAVLSGTSGPIKIVADMLGLDVTELAGVMTSSVTLTKGERICRNYSQDQAIDCRNAIAKAVYGRLFSWIVNKINSILAPRDKLDPAKSQEIGILDIFGFEHFEVNSFEQACINLANEQLQFFFNKHIFTLEQEEYRREGVDWKEIKFVDNQPLLDFFLARPIGLLSLLDEESQFPRGTDQSFVNKLNARFDHDPSFSKSPHSNSCSFTIHHYAGKVTYDATGWLEKNRDTQPPGTQEMLKSSTNPLLSLIFKGKITRTGTLALGHLSSRKTTLRMAKRQALQAKERKLTVGHQFKNSLGVLMERMTKSQPVFIRCIKPNSTKAAKSFDDDYVTEQLLYTGMLETTKIRREGFAVRPTFFEFVDKYKILVHQPALNPTPDNCRYVLQTSKLTGWHVGKTKVFMKYWHIDQLAEQMDRMAQQVVHMQRLVRGFLARKRVQKYQAQAKLQAEKLQELLVQIRSLSATCGQLQQAAITADSNIPKSFFQVNRNQKKGSMMSINTYLEPVEQHQKQTVTFSTQTQDAHDDDDTSSEDDFEPIKTTGMTEYGLAGTRQASARWFKETQCQTLVQPTGTFEEWFHGIITRREAERLLQFNKPVGCFLIRVSESRFGYSLSFRAEDRCRHYMIDQLPNGKFIILGEPKVHKTLHNLVEYHQAHHLSNWRGLLTEACGQEAGQCDYSDLMTGGGLYMDVEPSDTQETRMKSIDHAPPVPPPRVPNRNTKMITASMCSADVPPPLPERHYSLEKSIGRKSKGVHAAPPPQRYPYESLIEEQRKQNASSNARYSSALPSPDDRPLKPPRKN